MVDFLLKNQTGEVKTRTPDLAAVELYTRLLACCPASLSIHKDILTKSMDAIYRSRGVEGQRLRKKLRTRTTGRWRWIDWMMMMSLQICREVLHERHVRKYDDLDDGGGGDDDDTDDDDDDDVDVDVDGGEGDGKYGVRVDDDDEDHNHDGRFPVDQHQTILDKLKPLGGSGPHNDDSDDLESVCLRFGTMTKLSRMLGQHTLIVPDDKKFIQGLQDRAVDKSGRVLSDRLMQRYINIYTRRCRV
eukprot:754307-Hanusia_phi.AAC.2